MYDQIDTTAVYSSAASVLKAITYIIQDKKRDIDVDGVEPPREFGVFTENMLNDMKFDDWKPIWEYSDTMLIVTARQMF